MATEPNNICRVCLSFEGNFNSMKAHKLDTLFEKLTGFQANAERLPKFLCERCTNELRSYEQFRLTSKQSDELLWNILMRFKWISRENIEIARRENSNMVAEVKIEMPQPFELCDIKYDGDSDSETDFGDVFIQTGYNKTFINNDANQIIIDATATYNTAIDAAKTVTNLATADFDTVKSKIDTVKSKIDTAKSKTDAEKSKIDTAKSKIDAVKTKIVIKNKDTPNTKQRKMREKQVKLPKAKAIKTKVLSKRELAGKKLNATIKTFFTLKFLTYEQQVANMIKKQEAESYEAAPFKCTECYTGFFSASLYSNHMVRHTNAWGPYQCDICKAHYKSKRMMKTHLTHGAHNQHYSCKKCEFTTSHRTTALLHVRWHEGTSYKCEQCLRVFSRLTSYSNHMRVKHATEFVCALCGHNFVTEKGLSQHKSRQHRLNSEMVIGGPTCTTCNIRFVSDDALDTHMRVSPKHVAENTIWSSNYSRKHGYSTHTYKYKKNTTFSKNLTCEQCGLEMANAKAYYIHFRRAHPDKTRTNYPTLKTPSMCHVCGRIFQSVTHLNHHINKHTGEKPFKCDQCNKYYPSKVLLGLHMKRHSDKLANITYPCEMCNKHFTAACNRDKHIRIVHSDARPFPCDVCGKTFKSKYERKTHTDYVHLKKPWPKRTRHKDTVATRASEMDVELEKLL